MSSRPDRFLRACRREAVDCTPVWLMRQAGRYMPAYRAIRARHSMLDVIRNPALAAEITLQPVDAFDLDAAIIFSDLLPPLIGMGLDLTYEAGHGPRIENPITRTYDVDRLGTPPAEETMAGTLEAIRLVKAELAGRGLPLIGFAGAPFTLASYAIEGGGSKHYIKTKAFMYREPAAWRRLMEKLVTVVADFLLQQARAGADALQVFDSWAGTLAPVDYERYVLPYNRTLFERIGRAGVPTINFSTGTGAFIETVAASGGTVVGIDWRQRLDVAWQRIGTGRAVMGNLDPAALFAPWRELKPHLDDVLARAAGRPGHIFNLGHGILPETPVENVRRLVDYVHERTANRTPQPEAVHPEPGT
ncbi:uroporphyrinogen decarboxylase [Rhodocaloribacter litoris]|uniref:uroporphyrinogen decarboxylase n=1 Tax=Rhodocaloribacter litoris TaxID=2558931 RepID=UPI00141E7217|nr:uroporphyrinogen decarboxylase [Rhodocaloribacter litoris]QXD15686.1 uroporphyrinogen decarboxylase [Rhodocaloribacter litoris]GIV61621.1 MAG: uroporphyrinogen decarboxylase [Rhodothermaceae bacterium]